MRNTILQALWITLSLIGLSVGLWTAKRSKDDFAILDYKNPGGLYKLLISQQYVSSLIRTALFGITLSIGISAVLVRNGYISQSQYADLFVWLMMSMIFLLCSGSVWFFAIDLMIRSKSRELIKRDTVDLDKIVGISHKVFGNGNDQS